MFCNRICRLSWASNIVWYNLFFVRVIIFYKFVVLMKWWIIMSISILVFCNKRWCSFISISNSFWCWQMFLWAKVLFNHWWTIFAMYTLWFKTCVNFFTNFFSIDVFLVIRSCYVHLYFLLAIIYVTFFLCFWFLVFSF